MTLLFHTRENITAHPFEMPYIKRIIKRIERSMHQQTKGDFWIIDPFANNSWVTQLPNVITNDLNPKFDTSFNMEFNDFGELMEAKGNQAQLILFDPPYSLTQLKMQYDGIGKDLPQWQTQNPWKRGKDALSRCQGAGGIIISLGWTTSGFGAHRGYEKREIHVIEGLAREDQHSMFVVIEEKTQTSILDYA